VNFEEIKKTLQDLSSFSNIKLLLAHSGGVDSSVLAELLLSKNIEFSVAHCNFKLRGERSDADEQFVMDWCNSQNIPFFLKMF
jgi:tRNA(Ile)-lysidine synthase